MSDRKIDDSLLGGRHPIVDTYDENTSLIGEIFEVVDRYVNESTIVERSAIAYEALSTMFKQYDTIWERIGTEDERKKKLEENKSNNKPQLLPSVDDLGDAIGNVLGSLSLSSFGIDNIVEDTVALIQNPTETLGNFLNEAKDSAVEASIQQLQALMARTVGPFEEIPASMMIDSIRRASVVTNTQTAIEHSMLAKLHQLKGNRLSKEQSFLGTNLLDTSKIFGNVESFFSDIGSLDPSSQLKKALTNQGGNGTIKFPIPTGPIKLPIIPKFGPSFGGTYGNKYLPNRFGGPEYKPSDLEAPGFDFKIMNLANGKTMSFPAYIESINEEDSASWNSISLINRSEDIYTYQRAERTFTMDFMLFADGGDIPVVGDFGPNSGKGLLEELGTNPMRNKLTGPNGEQYPLLTKSEVAKRKNFLHQCQRPKYSYGKYQSAPYCRLWVGSMFRGIYCIIESTNFSYDPLIWDLNDNDIVPMIMKITLNGKLLHGASLSADSEDFYNFDKDSVS